MGACLPRARRRSGGAPNFPPSIPLYQQGYKNWAGDIVVDRLWTHTLLPA